MNPNFDIYGVYIPTLAVIALVSYVIHAVLKRALAYIRFYRIVWHRPLFDLAMYVCILSALALSLNRVFP